MQRKDSRPSLERVKHTAPLLKLYNGSRKREPRAPKKNRSSKLVDMTVAVQVEFS